jgi:hypothetical protein
MTTRHLLTEIDTENRIAFCSACDTIVQIKNARGKEDPSGPFWRCKRQYKSKTLQLTKPWVLQKKDFCEWKGGCDFHIEHPCQLSVDHIDGNKANNEPDNLQTLCLNHHALKTLRNNDWIRKDLKPI